ncbi:MAG: 2'-5' RNA ligase family protein [Frankia sp.]
MTPREIGVAIGLPEPLGAHLRSWRDRFGDPAARLIVPHVTLLGPTIVDEATLATVVRHLARAAATIAPFTLRLTGTDTFLPITPVVYLAVVAGATQCESLAAAVRAGPLAVPLRFPYHPHVTLAQNVPRAALDAARERFAGFDAVVDVASFGLFHRDARGWRMSHEFALGARPDRVSPTNGQPGVPTATPA